MQSLAINNLFDMKKMMLAAAGLLIMFIQSFAQDSTGNSAPLTLKECIETALANNINVKRSEYTMDNDKVSLQLAKGQLLPSLNANIIHGNNQGRNINP